MRAGLKPTIGGSVLGLLLRCVLGTSVCLSNDLISRTKKKFLSLQEFYYEVDRITDLEFYMYIIV